MAALGLVQAAQWHQLSNTMLYSDIMAPPNAGHRTCTCTNASSMLGSCCAAASERCSSLAPARAMSWEWGGLAGVGRMRRSGQDEAHWRLTSAWAR